MINNSFFIKTHKFMVSDYTLNLEFEDTLKNLSGFQILRSLCLYVQKQTNPRPYPKVFLKRDETKENTN